MNLSTRLLLPLAAAAMFAAPVHAQQVRIPAEGAPAIVVDKQSGWTEKYDDFGNLTFFADDAAGGLLFRTIEAGPNETMPGNAAVAEMILGAAGAQPPSRTEQVTFAGGPAEAFYSTMQVDGGPKVELKVVIRRIGDRHLAVGVTMIPETTNAAGRAKVEAQFARVTIATR